MDLWASTHSHTNDVCIYIPYTHGERGRVWKLETAFTCTGESSDESFAVASTLKVARVKMAD